jgi:hypothetical protein
MFKQASRSLVKDQNIVVANLQYVGVLKEILVVAYSNLCVVLFHCSWIPPNM